jgi:hypothetical protein
VLFLCFIDDEPVALRTRLTDYLCPRRIWQRCCQLVVFAAPQRSGIRHQRAVIVQSDDHAL